MQTLSRAFLETVLDPLALVATSGNVVDANSAFHSAFSRDAARSLLTLFGPAIKESLAAAGSEPVTVRLELAGPEPGTWYRVSLATHAGSDILTALLVDVSEEERQSKRVEQYEREIRLLGQIGATLAGSFELDAITNRIGEQVARLARTQNFYIALYDRDSGVVSFPRYIEDGVWHSQTSRPFANGLTEYVIATGTPLMLNRSVLERSVALGIEPVGKASSAWLGVPIGANGDVLGVIAIQEYDRYDCYDRHHVEVLGIIANQAAAVIKHASLLEASRRAYQELSETQTRLLESERVRAITEAVGTMNHEVNNPLAAIVGNAQLLLRRRESLSTDIATKVESILDGAQRIQEVTGKMSKLIQASSIPYPGETAIVDVRRSVAEGDACDLPAMEPRKLA